MRYAAFLLSVALVPVFAQNSRSLVSERFTGRYHCGGAWRDFEFFASPVMGLLGVVDPALDAATPYFWRVQACNNSNECSAWAVRSFRAP